jgi:prenyl protein peptidase
MCCAHSSDTACAQDGATSADVLRALGLRREGLLPACAAGLGLTGLLFLGHACGALSASLARRAAAASAGGGASPPKPPPPARRGSAWDSARLLLVAPICEEWAFRGCMVPLLLSATAGGAAAAAAGAAPPAVVAGAPLFFGAAHLHHLVELIALGGCSWRRAGAQVGAQFCMTYAFGAYATFLFLRTRQLAAPLLAHALCNFMGAAAPPRAFWPHSALGVALFAALLRPATAPRLFGS